MGQVHLHRKVIKMNKLQAVRRFVIEVASDHGYDLCKVMTFAIYGNQFWFKSRDPKDGGKRRIAVTFRVEDLYDPTFKQRIEEQLGEAVSI